MIVELFRDYEIVFPTVSRRQFIVAHDVKGVDPFHTPKNRGRVVDVSIRYAVMGTIRPLVNEYIRESIERVERSKRSFKPCF